MGSTCCMDETAPYQPDSFDSCDSCDSFNPFLPPENLIGLHMDFLDASARTAGSHLLFKLAKIAQGG
eukprot:1143455-Rhodomonas_salina.1